MKKKSERAAYKRMLQDDIKKIESCKGEQGTCDCKTKLKSIHDNFGKIKTSNEEIIEKVDDQDVEEEIYVEETYINELEVKIERLKKKVSSHPVVQKAVVVFKPDRVKEIMLCTISLRSVKFEIML